MCFFPFSWTSVAKLYLAPLTTVGPTAGWAGAGNVLITAAPTAPPALGAWVHIWGPSLAMPLRVPSTVPSVATCLPPDL